MQATHRTALSLILFLALILACDLPGAAPAIPVTGGTAGAQTVAAIVQATQGALTAANPVTAFPTATQTVTASATPITPSPIPTDTPTATLGFTATPLVPQISVSIATNCRTGPGKVYDMVGWLPVGKVVQIYGRDPTGRYWLIENPDSPGQFCWVWGEYATLTGNTTLLPVMTPPPTPTATSTSRPTKTPTPTSSPGYSLSFDGKVSCANWWPEIGLHNTGGTAFRSVGMTVRDTVTSTVASSLADGFTDHPDCVNSNSHNVLYPGQALTVSGPAFSYDPTGHSLVVHVTLCSSTGQNGTCLTEDITFTP